MIYTQTVVQSVPFCQKEVESWLNSRDELGAKNLIKSLQEDLHPTSQKRYRFVNDWEHDALKAIFDAAMKSHSNYLTQEAEAIRGKPFYPLWKRVCKINAPKAIGSLFGDHVFKIIVTLASCILLVATGYRAYAALNQYVIARALPLIINKTSVVAIRAFNAVMQGFDWIYKNSFKILIGIFLTREIVKMLPEVPYISSAIKAISIYNLWCILYATPNTLAAFLIGMAIDAGGYVKDCCSSVSEFFNQISEQAEAEKLAISKAQAYQLWLEGVRS